MQPLGHLWKWYYRVCNLNPFGWITSRIKELIHCLFKTQQISLNGGMMVNDIDPGVPGGGCRRGSNTSPQMSCTDQHGMKTEHMVLDADCSASPQWFLSQGTCGNAWRHVWVPQFSGRVILHLIVETRDPAKHPVQDRCSNSKEWSDQNANNVKIKKTWLTKHPCFSKWGNWGSVRLNRSQKISKQRKQDSTCGTADLHSKCYITA